jgi:outer membrane usher protein
MAISPLRRLGAWAALIALLTLPAVHGVCAAESEATDLTEAVLEVSVNMQKPTQMIVLLKDENGQLWVQESDFAALRLRLPDGTPRLVAGQRYYPLQTVPGITLEVDDRTQSVAVNAPAAAFLSTRIDTPAPPTPVITQASPGAFLNYQLSALRVAGEGSLGGTGELGLFAAPGVFTNSAVYRDGAGLDALIRLDSTFTHDLPQRLESLVLGDAISDAGTWGNAVRFAGIRWGTNFALRPDLLTTPLLAAAGTAVVPSTADIFVNNQQIGTQQLPPGPFVIDRLPSVTGSGQVSVVVRDALGREQLITQPFYSSATLLAPGLSQYAVDLGAIRNNYALSSADYGSALGVLDYRRGLSTSLTVAAHAEYLEHDAHAAGVNLAQALGTLGIANVTAGAGGDDHGSGYLSGLGFEHIGGRVSVTASTLFASHDFRQVGDSSSLTPPYRERDLLQAGLTLTRASSLALALVHESYDAQPSQQTLSLTYSIVLGDYGALSLMASHTQAQQTQNSYYLSYTLPLANRRAVSLAAVGGSGQGPGGNQLYATYLQNPPVGPGTGYRLAVSSAGNYDADWRRQAVVGDIELEAARNQGVSGESALWSGAATWMDGQLRATRSVNDSFALVDLDGIPNVPVYIDHQLVAHTDAQGFALLHDLLPYQANRIDVEPTELPLDTQIDARVMVLEPPYRSGVVARFPVERIRGGTFHLVTADGNPVPAGALVNFQGAVFPVAYDGVTYVTGFDHGTEGRARWGDRQCTFRLPPPPPDDPLPDVGRILCDETRAPAATEP